MYYSILSNVPANESPPGSPKGILGTYRKDENWLSDWRCSKFWLRKDVGHQTALNRVLVHRIIPIQLFQLHRHHMECSLQKVNPHSTLLIPPHNHHKDIKNDYLHSCSLLNSYNMESKCALNLYSCYSIICWDRI